MNEFKVLLGPHSALHTLQKVVAATLFLEGAHLFQDAAFFTNADKHAPQIKRNTVRGVFFCLALVCAIIHELLSQGAHLVLLLSCIWIDVKWDLATQTATIQKLGVEEFGTNEFEAHVN